MLPVSCVPPLSRRAPNWVSEEARTWEHHHPQPTIPPPRLNRQAESRRKAASWLHLLKVSPALHPPERPPDTHTPKPGFGGRWHESTIEPYKNRAWVNSKMSGRNSLVYCTFPLIVMQGYPTNTEDTGSLGYNSFCYIASRIEWVSMKGRIYRYRCRRDPGKLYNNYCYTHLTKDQHQSSNLVVHSTIQCSTIEVMI